MQILGIVNITPDSFSDGGKFLKLSDSIRHCDSLVSDGANILDLGAQSSNPQANAIDPQLEWERLEPVIQHCQMKKIKISVDTFRPYILDKAIGLGIDYINDITALKDTCSIEVLKKDIDRMPEIILMFSHNQAERAEGFTSSLTTKNIVDKILYFFDTKINSLIKEGIPSDKLIFDPGMGFFLGADPFLSIIVLKNIRLLKKKLGRVLVSVSRKSFIGNLLGQLPVDERASGTLASEIYSYMQGVDYIRTHDVKQLAHSIQIINYLQGEIL
jgi:dihydropteroate synthase